MEKLIYGNWIRKRNLWLLAGCAFILSLAAFLPILPLLRLAFGVLAGSTWIAFLIPFGLYWAFSPKGGNLQKKFYDAILDHLENHAMGSLLDVGTGNGILAVLAAWRNQATQVTGVDYWGRDWEYSRAVCEKNAQVAGVDGRVCFQKGDAASLNFPDGTFDAVVSNLTFHEVRLVKRKTDVMREALRVLKPGGSFAFIDYFYEARHYGDTPEFEILLWSLGLKKVELIRLDQVVKIPRLLGHRRLLGRIGLIYGVK
jgi:SAM-dependent methyltransferase